MPNVLPEPENPVAARRRLAESLAALTRQYAGELPGARGTGPAVAVDPADVLPKVGAPVLPGLPAGAFVPTAQQLAAVAGGGGGALGPYNLAGDGGAWGPTGINQYNPYLARGDMPAPGPVGRGPGFWLMDNYGTPFWRSDWDPSSPGGMHVFGED
jgi:hypothetical protein